MRAVLSVILIAFLWLAGFFAYLLDMDQPSEFHGKADAIIVLTGGKNRIPEALELLNDKKADLLLISGVGQGVTLDDLTNGNQDFTPAKDPAVSSIAHVKTYQNSDKQWLYLDYNPTTTKENALFTRQWVQQKKIKSLYLVTANYHMARSLREFQERMPGVTIYPQPVKRMNPFDWKWINNDTLRYLFIAEYHKLLGTWVSYGIKALLIKLGTYPKDTLTNEKD